MPTITQLVTLETAKQYLEIPETDTASDANLTRIINACTPLIERYTGPIVPQKYVEWHDGGNYFILPRRRPTTSYSSSPLFVLESIAEWRGPTEYPLEIVQNPGEGGLYSVLVDNDCRIVRRTSGGGVIGYMAMPQSIKIEYEAGQQEVPANVEAGACELVRHLFRQSRPVGRGREVIADSEQQAWNAPFAMPNLVRELIAPAKKAPSIA